MQIPKEKIIDMLRSQGHQDKVDEAEQKLPDSVDPEQHADLLSSLGVDPKAILGELGGGLPNL